MQALLHDPDPPDPVDVKLSSIQMSIKVFKISGAVCSPL